MTSYTPTWPSRPLPALPLARLFVVRARVLAARAEYVHDFRDETGEHRLRRRHLQLSQSQWHMKQYYVVTLSLRAAGHITDDSASYSIAYADAKYQRIAIARLYCQFCSFWNKNKSAGQNLTMNRCTRISISHFPSNLGLE